MRAKKSIMDIASEGLDCYVSDLRKVNSAGRVSKGDLKKIIQKLKPESFTLQEWNGACEYILEDNIKAQSQKEAWELLIKCLE